MTLDDQKEQFSFAYVRAVAAVTGVTVSEPAVDDDSIDLMLKMRTTGGTTRSPQVDAQIKCTEAALVTDDFVSFPLKIKNYEELRPTNLLVPRILVVVTVSDTLSDWVSHSEQELAMRRCGYWVSLRGLPPTASTSKVSVRLPRKQPFTVAELSAIMQRVGNGQLP